MPTRVEIPAEIWPALAGVNDAEDQLRAAFAKDTKYTPKKYRSSAAGKTGWKKSFLDALSRIPNVSLACKMARISRRLPYAERQSKQWFREQWAAALARGIELLEAECWRRAYVGTERGVWMKDEHGQPVKVETVREFSDILAIFLLKAHAPHKYRDTLGLRTASRSE